MTAPLAFWIPALPRRVLSSNAPGEDRTHWAITDAKMALGLYTETALKPKHEPLPHFEFARVIVTAHVAVDKKPKLEQCPRCLAEYFQGPWQGKLDKKTGVRAAPTCRCYRPTDPPNLGSETTKPLTDTLRKVGVITDDSYKYLDGVYYRIEREESVAEEGIAVVVEPLPPLSLQGANN